MSRETAHPDMSDTPLFSIEHRLAGAQWVMFGHPQEAERYLAALVAEDNTVRVVRTIPFPNPQGLYASLHRPDRVVIDQILISTATTQD
jgi:hypothetical protein